MRDLSPLLNPSSVTVIGASEKPGSFGGQVLKNLIDFAYPGKLSAVHPRLEQCFERPCYPTLSSMPFTPDCIALAVANHQLLTLLEEAAGIGVRSAVVFGDPNVGAGRAPELQGEIARVCDHHGIIVCGPNAMGLYALHRRMVISGYPVDPALPQGQVALITHSGTVFDALSQNDRNVGFNYVIAGGNEASITAADYLHFVLDDPGTRAVACYLETVRDPDSFVAALQRAEMTKIPIIALKVGLSEKGKIMTQAHTGALAGGGETYRALFERYGVTQVHSLDEMMDCIELFGAIQPLTGNRLSVLMESGGERSLVADLSEDLDLEFADFSATTRQGLRDCLDEGVELENPLDAFGTGHDVPGVYARCLQLMDADPGTDLVVLAVDLVRDSYLSPAYVSAVLSQVEHKTKPLATLVNLTAGANRELMATLRSTGVPVLMGTETGLRAIHHLSRFSRHQPVTSEFRGRPCEAIVCDLRARLATAERALDEYESKQMLAAYGIRTTRDVRADSLDGTLEAARRIGYPVALKSAQPGLLHKSEAGGIILNVSDEESLTSAYSRLDKRLGPHVVIQEMISAGIEMLLGMKSDPQFGPIILVGFGGIFVEILRDVSVCMPAFGERQARDMLSKLRGYCLLQGVRGQQAVDIDDLIDQILRFATFIADFGEHLSEVDINPLVVSPQGARVVDALLVPSPYVARDRPQ